MWNVSSEAGPIQRIQEFLAMKPPRWLLMCVVVVGACRRQDVAVKETTMPTDDSMFSQVQLNVNSRNPCSPAKPSPTWHGVLINAPRQVRFRPGNVVGETKAFAAIPICGVNNIHLGDDNLTDEPLTLVAVDKQTGHVYSGAVYVLDPSPVAPLPPDVAEKMRPEKIPGQYAGRYFNPNLADFVPLPQKSATYDVHVQFRGLKSNTVSLELIREVP
jgi:hypothetical protein